MSQTQTVPKEVIVAMNDDINDGVSFEPLSMVRPDRQHRKFLITQNNPRQYGLNASKMREMLLAMEGIRYACGCEEVSTTGTPHIHMFFEAPGKKRFSVVKKRFPHAHIETAYGSCLENRDYIAKAGKWEDGHKADTKVEGSFWEHGMLPSERAEKEPDMAAIMDMIEDGATTSEIVKKFPKYALQTKKLDDLQKTLRVTTSNEITRDMNVIYILGPDTVDKVGIIYHRHEAKDICRIAYYPDDRKRLPSFDAYNGQPILIFDNFYGQIPLGTMLYLLDRYPVMLPVRYADKAARYTTVYIISTISPEMLYCNSSASIIRDIKAFTNSGFKLTERGQYHFCQMKQFLNLIDTIIKIDEDSNIIIEEAYHYEPAYNVDVTSIDEP